MCFWNPFSMSLPNLSETQINISIMSVQCVFPFLRVNAGRHNNRTAFGCWENPGVLGKHKAQIQPPRNQCGGRLDREVWLLLPLPSRCSALKFLFVFQSGEIHVNNLKKRSISQWLVKQFTWRPPNYEASVAFCPASHYVHSPAVSHEDLSLCQLCLCARALGGVRWVPMGNSRSSQLLHDAFSQDLPTITDQMVDLSIV